MYCSNCGNLANGNFCSVCGAALTSVVAPQQPAADAATDLAAVARLPQVKQIVAQHAALYTKRLSGEEFVKFFDKPFVALAGLPISPIATVAGEVYGRLGVKTGKARRARVGRPMKEVFVATLCSLARNGQVIKQLHTATDGCAIEAALPSDIWSFEGILTVVLKSGDGATDIEAQTSIRGQLYDWGKSKRALDVLFHDVATIPVLL